VHDNIVKIVFPPSIGTLSMIRNNWNYSLNGTGWENQINIENETQQLNNCVLLVFE
jgi:hypothetical protein